MSFLLLLSLVYVATCHDGLYIDFSIAYGRYTSSDRGIVFNSSSTSLSIFDLFGQPLLLVYKTTSSTTDSRRLIKIQNDLFIQVYVNENQTFRDYYIPDFMYKESMNLHDVDLSSLDFLSSYYHHNKLMMSVKTLINNPNSALIKEAAYSYGIVHNINGNVYPSILPFYLVASLFENSIRYSGNTSTFEKFFVNDKCFDECPPCPDNECLSLCGYGCNCWKWICGDCCFHLGCYGHDICCRKNFVQTKCLFPMNFKCESEYSC